MSDLSKKELNEYKREYIKKYMDGTYDIMKKYKNELLKAIQKDKVKTYDEALCYDYKVVEVIHIFPTYTDKAITPEEAEKITKANGAKYTKVKYTEDADKIIKQYQQRNKK
jgi:hypothetical protein